MKWYTCIVHVENHVTPVQYFYTRAETPQAAAANAAKWFADEPSGLSADVEYIFEGKLDPVQFNQSSC